MAWAARCQNSAVSGQLLRKRCDFSSFYRQKFFAFCKEVTDKDPIAQQDWNEPGPAAFAVEVLDTLEPREDPGYDPHQVRFL